MFGQFEDTVFAAILNQLHTMYRRYLETNGTPPKYLIVGQREYSLLHQASSGMLDGCVGIERLVHTTYLTSDASLVFGMEILQSKRISSLEVI